MTQPNPNQTKRIPQFKSIQEAAEFWDTHSSFEFPDEFEDDEIELENPHIQQYVEIILPDTYADKLSDLSEKQHTSAAELVRSWAMEKLDAMCDD